MDVISGNYYFFTRDLTEVMVVVRVLAFEQSTSDYAHKQQQAQVTVRTKLFPAVLGIVDVQRPHLQHITILSIFHEGEITLFGGNNTLLFLWS